jgi:hypothetical protein
MDRWAVRPEFVYHFSEEPEIRRFRPHVASTKPGTEPLVWAIDAAHAPLYWFPRECPRVTFWAGPETPAVAIDRYLSGDAGGRVHAFESAWLERLRAARLFVYRFPAADFEALAEADGHWIARREVAPLDVEPVGDLLARHAEAGIELRMVPSLWPLHDAVPGTGLRFSIVRMRNAQPRP